MTGGLGGCATMYTALSPNPISRARRGPEPAKEGLQKRLPVVPEIGKAENALVDAQLETFYLSSILAHLKWVETHPQVTDGTKAALMMRIGKELVQHFVPCVLPVDVDWDDFFEAVTRIPGIDKEMRKAIQDLGPVVLGTENDEGAMKRSIMERVADTLSFNPMQSTKDTQSPVCIGANPVTLADMSATQRMIALAISDAETPGVLVPIVVWFAVFFTRWRARWKRDENQTYLQALLSDGEVVKDVVLGLVTCLLVYVSVVGQADYSALGPVEGNPLVVALTKDLNIARGVVLEDNIVVHQLAGGATIAGGTSRNNEYVREFVRAQQVVETLLSLPLYQVAHQDLVSQMLDTLSATTDYSTEGVFEALSEFYAGDGSLMATPTWDEAKGVVRATGMASLFYVVDNYVNPRPLLEERTRAVRDATRRLIMDVRAAPQTYASQHQCAVVLHILALLLAVIFGVPTLTNSGEDAQGYNRGGRARGRRRGRVRQDAAFSVVEQVFARQISNGRHA